MSKQEYFKIELSKGNVSIDYDSAIPQLYIHTDSCSFLYFHKSEIDNLFKVIDELKQELAS